MDRELTILEIGYTAAMQDIYTEIMKCNEEVLKDTEYDKKTLDLINTGISQAFLNLNKNFKGKTALLYLQILENGK